jgi:hypothetical protein
MDSIKFDNTSNLGSLSKIYFIEIEKVATEPRVLNLVALDDIVLEEGEYWKEMYSTRNKAAFSEPQQKEGSKIIYNQSVQGYIPKSSQALANNLANGKRQQYAVVAKDNNGELRWIGTKKNPCLFNYSFTTNAMITGGNGYTYNFYRRSHQPAPSYDGLLNVDGSVVFSETRRTTIILTFTSLADDVQTITIKADQSGNYQSVEADSNITASSFKVNTIAAPLPFNLVAGDELEITITRTLDQLSTLKLKGIY